MLNCSAPRPIRAFPGTREAREQGAGARGFLQEYHTLNAWIATVQARAGRTKGWGAHMRGGSNSAGSKGARTLARRVSRGAGRVRMPLAWSLAYILFAQLILSGFSAGAAMAALSHDQAPAFCSGRADAAPPQDQAPHRAPHCLLCPQAGLTPLLPIAPTLPAPQAAFGLAADAVSQPAEPRFWAIHEGARTRAPPLGGTGSA